MAAQGGEACVHLGSKDTGGGAGVGILRPETSVRMAGRQFLGDGDGFWDDGAFWGAHRGGGAGGEEVFENVRQLIGVKPGRAGLYRDAEGVEEEPAAKAPAGIGAVADHEVVGGFVIGHVFCPFFPFDPAKAGKGNDDLWAD